MGPETSNGVTESMGLRADLAPPAGRGPLIATGLAALAPSSWDLGIAANSAPGASFVMVANVSRQLASVEALWKLLSDTTERDSIEAVRRSCLENAPCLGQDSSVACEPAQYLREVRIDSGVPSSPVLGAPTTPNTTARLSMSRKVGSVLCRLVHGTVRQSDHCVPRGLITWDSQNFQTCCNPNRNAIWE